MNLSKLIIAALLLTGMCACHNQAKTKSGDHDVNHDSNSLAHSPEANPHWAYEGDDGPEKWASLCPAFSECKGNHQSPIDISADLATSTDLKIEKNYSYVSGVEFVNNGHSIQVNIPGDKANVLKLDGKEFVLKQFHFHCPSEHSLDGKLLAGEAHFVHVAADGHISVLGVFIEEGEENPFIEKLIHHLPKEVNEKTIVTESICAQSAFSEHDEFFIYEGSLTTPPCTEGVHWFVRKRHIQATAEQIEALHKAMPDHNNRPIQPKNDREFGKLANI